MKGNGEFLGITAEQIEAHLRRLRRKPAAARKPKRKPRS